MSKVILNEEGLKTVAMMEINKGAGGVCNKFGSILMYRYWIR
jgi:hypothetical protein